MLKEIELTNFKSFAHEPQKIPFAPVTVFVGANGSGKSNVLDSIRVLRGIGKGLSIGECLEGEDVSGESEYTGIRGGAAEAFWSNEEPFRIATTLDVERLSKHVLASFPKEFAEIAQSVGPTAVLRHMIECSRLPDRVTVGSENLRTQEGLEVFASVGTDVEFVSFPESTTLGLGSGRLSIIDGLTPHSEDFSRLDQIPDFPQVHPWVRLCCAATEEAYRHLQFIDIQPKEMKNYVPASFSRDVGSRGELFSAVLYRLVQDSSNKESILDWISEVCAPRVRDIVFDRTGLGHVLAQLVEGELHSKTVSARALSDGTLRFLGLLTALLSAAEGSVILLEEIETGLHPTRVHLIVELLEQVAEARGIQIIATTHSSQALLALSKPAQENVVLFSRTDDYPGTKVTRLGDIPHFDDVMKESRIDELFTTGWMEFAVA